MELKIIDFAHAIPKTDKDGQSDDGFLFGLRNLVILFQNIARHDAQGHSDTDEDSESSEEEPISEDEERWKMDRPLDFIINQAITLP